MEKGAGADSGFFLGRGALVSCSTSTPINHIVFFLQNTSCVRKPGRGGGAHPLHPPPRSAPGGGGYENYFISCSNNKDQNGFSIKRKVFFKFLGLWVMVIGRGTFLLHLGCPVDNRSVFFMYKD